MYSCAIVNAYVFRSKQTNVPRLTQVEKYTHLRMILL